MQAFNLIKGVSVYYLITVIFTLLFVLIFQNPNDYLWSLGIPFLLFALVLFLYQQLKDVSEKHFITSIFIWSLILRIAAVYIIGFILINYNGMPFLSLKDDFTYQKSAVAIMNRWKISGFGFYSNIKFSADTYSGFPNFSAALMTLFDNTSPFLPRLGNAFLSSITCILSYKIVKKYSDTYEARFIGIILTFLPLTITFSAMQFKDTLLLFFIILGVYASISIISGKHILSSIILLVASYIGCSFGRPAVIVPLAASLIIMIGRSAFESKSQGMIIKIISVLLIIYLLTFSYQYLASVGFVDIDDYFESRYYGLSEADIQSSQAGIRKMSISQFLGAPLYLVGGPFLPPPLIVNIDNTVNYSAWAIISHYAFLPFLMIAMWKSIIWRKSNPIPFFLFLVYFFFRIGQANSLMTSFSPRQSLATLFIMYLILPMYEKGMKKWEYLVFALSLATMFTYNYVRLLSHHMI